MQNQLKVKGTRLRYEIEVIYDGEPSYDHGVKISRLLLLLVNARFNFFLKFDKSSLSNVANGLISPLVNEKKIVYDTKVTH